MTESGYQDAWNTPGYTSQWSNLPDATPGSSTYAAFDIPAGMQTQFVTGSWRDNTGPAWGNLLFTPSVPSILVNDVEVELSPFRVYLHNGSLPDDFAVPAPDPATCDPVSMTWNVTGRIGPRNVSYVIPSPGVTPFDLPSLGRPTN